MTVKMKMPYLKPEWIEAADKLKALSHPIRLYIITLLKIKKEMSVTEFQNELNIEQAVVSHHLNILKNKNVLLCRREGKNIYYSLKNKNILNILTCIETKMK